MKITKIFNNSAVLGVDEHGREAVLFGRGIGFRSRTGDIIDDSVVDKRFVPGDLASTDRIVQYLEDIPVEDIDLADSIIAEAKLEFGQGVSEHAVLPLADHLSFALRRLREGMELEYGMHWEVESLYPRELAFAQKMLALIAERRGVVLPDGEAIPLALHFVNAQFGAGEMSETMRITDALLAVMRTAATDLGIEFDAQSVFFARFVTHVRYLILRRIRGQRAAGIDPSVGDAVRVASPLSYSVAESMADELSARFGWEVEEEERFYLALHVYRLAGQS